MKKAMLVIALALAGCAGVARSAEKDPLAGNWVGVIDRDGWQRPLSVMIDARGGGYTGSWMSVENQPGVMVQRVQRSADEAEGAHAPVDLRALLDDALAREDAALSQAGVTVIREYGPPLRVAGDPQKLGEAFSELMVNARRAMPGGGQLTVGYRSIDGQLAAVHFADTGKGIAAEIRGRIFEPFFTTKTDWNAKGLGLTMVHRVCEAHHGRVTVESEPGKGATFTVLLPVLQDRALA